MKKKAKLEKSTVGMALLAAVYLSISESKTPLINIDVDLRTKLRPDNQKLQVTYSWPLAKITHQIDNPKLPQKIALFLLSLPGKKSKKALSGTIFQKRYILKSISFCT